MNDEMISPAKLLPMQPCRVWRCYTGGYLLDRFVGNPDPRDTHTPEDWLASTVRAINGEHSQGPDEGLARVALPDGTSGPLLRDILAAGPQGYLGKVGEPALDVLCKFLDSAVRLPIQCHPDLAFARQHYHSSHGKAESWIILDTRVIDGEAPYLLMGFKPGISRDDFAEVVRTQDIKRMENMLHRIPVQPGEIYFIPGRFPHAIGAGVFMLEVQEPSDWVVQPEKNCAGTPLSDEDMWGPLTPELALDCFAYQGETAEEVLRRTRLTPRITTTQGNNRIEEVIGKRTTECFYLDRLTINDDAEFFSDFPYHIEIVTAGEGTLQVQQQTIDVQRGAVIFVPNGVKSIRYTAASSQPLIVCRASGGME